MKEKKTPLRMCVVCRGMKDKKELTRIVRDKSGTVFFDPTLKASGRGAYVCNNQECVERCVKKRMLNKSFKAPLDASVYERLREEYANRES